MNPRAEFRRMPMSFPEPYLKTLALYRTGCHWDAHEALEDAWREEQDPVRRRFYHGIIQLAAACHHMDRGNMHGLKTLVRKALEKLRDCPSPYLGLDVARLCERMEVCLRTAEAVQRGEIPAFDKALKPPLEIDQPLPNSGPVTD